MKPNIIKHFATAPIAQLSIFGWLILGPVHTVSTTHCSTHNATIWYDDAATSELLTKFSLPSHEQECEEHFLSTHPRDLSERYIIRIPLKSPLTGLGNSYGTAQHCLQRMLKRLSRDETLHTLYHQFMKEYEELNHMVKARSITQTGAVPYYLPHHEVLKPDSTATKLRVVFNGFSPTSTGKSRHDLMHTEENLLLDISDVLIRIRHHWHIFATDITGHH